VISALGLFLFTAVAGRLWCGYACPQTVYTEMFLWVERKIEGDRVARMRLDRSAWTVAKLARKGAKQVAWLGIGLVTGVTFVGYFTPIRTLVLETASAALSPSEWFWILLYGLATYANAGYVREQMCKYICPYARFQSALIDKDSLVITYDAARGEPRGSRPRKAAAADLGLGACIDCTLCAQVCPNGVDIRDGLQNECIGCAACIDVCNSMMGKMGYAPGLIRYSTENAMVHGWARKQLLQRLLRPRVLVYACVLLTASAAFAISIAMRSPFLVDVIKDRGSLGRIVGAGSIENVYRVQIMNRTEHAQSYRVAASGPPGLTLSVPDLTVPAADIRSIAFALRLPPDAAQRLRGRSVSVTIEVSEILDGHLSGFVRREASTFLVPR
jgi:cytochrome c oxidase accessory protein FixG